jgi:glycyl-tRNA synthetase beta chain
VEAVLTIGIDDLTDAVNRIEALQQMKKDADFESLSISFKRVVNILKKESFGQEAAPDAFEDDAERSLHQKYLEIRDTVEKCMAQKKYLDALRLISTIRESVDAFFDNVMVMAEDINVRQNRLALLGAIASLFTGFADFSKIAAE